MKVIRPKGELSPKAARIRARCTETPKPSEPAIDWDDNVKLIKELDAFSSKNGISSYIVMIEAVPLCTIVFKRTEKQLTAFVTAHVNGRRLMTKKVVKGTGFDRETAALDGVMLYPHDTPNQYIRIEDKGARWYHFLSDRGCKVWQTM
jgi:hypothetical protein